MKLKLLVVLFLLSAVQSFAQSSKGNRFWVAFMENILLVVNDDPVFRIHIDADETTNLTISRPANGWSQNYIAAGGTVTVITLPDEVFYTIGSEEVADFGFLIEADNPVKVSAVHNRAYFSESSLLLPETELGTDYLITCYADGAGIFPSATVIVATQDNTNVEIIPATATIGGQAAVVPFNITLDTGESYQIKGDGDLTGSQIRSLNGAPIAVFAGSQQSIVATCLNGAADNHIYEQQLPEDSFSDLFYFVPFEGQGGDVVRVLFTEDNTTLYFDCNEITTLDRGEYYTGKIVSPTVITATANVSVFQLNESQTCNTSGIGDPNMLQVLPIRDKTREARFWAPGEINGLGFSYFNRHFVNIITRTDNVGEMELDGNDITNEFEPFAADPEWSSAQIQLPSTGAHQLTSTELFQAYSYGFGDFDAYSTTIGYEEQVQEDFVCLDIQVEGLFCVDSILTFFTESNLAITQWNWNFGDGTTSTAAMPTHSYSQAGTYTVTVEVVFSNGGTDSASLELTIQDCPDEPCENSNFSVNIQFDQDACLEDEFVFTYNANGPVTSQIWDFGNGFTSTDVAGITNYLFTGTYTVTLTVFDQYNCDFTVTLPVEVVNCDPCAQAGEVPLTYEGVLCTGSEITFFFPVNVDPDANPLFVYQWFINGELFEVPNPTVTFSDPGPLSVEFLAQDLLNGCDFVGGIDLFVEDCEDPCGDGETVSINVDGEFCTGQTMAFSTQTTANLVNITWQASNGIQGEGEQFEVTFEGPGVYSVNVVAIDADGCLYDASLAFDVEDCDPCDNLPDVDISFDGVACVDSLLAFAANTSANLQSFSWTFSDGTTSLAENPTLTFTTPGTYSVSFEGTDAQGCVYEAELAFLIQDCDPNCQGVINIVLDGEICQEEPGTLSLDTDLTIMSYSWQINNEPPVTTSSVEVSLEEPGTYFFTVEVVADDGCVYQDDLFLSIDDCFDPCENTPPVDLIVDGFLCVGELIAVVLDTEAQIVEVEWMVNMGDIQNTDIFSFIATEAGTYTIDFTGMDANGCEYVESISFDVENCVPGCDANINIILDGEICQPIPATLSAESNVTIVDYSWQINGEAPVNSPTVEVSLLEPGTYTFVLTAVTIDDCVYEETLALVIDECEPFEVCNLGLPNAFSPNDDGFNDQFTAFFDCPPLEYQMRIFDRWGELVFETDDVSQGWDGDFRSEPMQTGVYIWVVDYTNNAGEVLQKKGDLVLLR